MVSFVFSYLYFHYTRSLADFFGVARNLLWFVYHFFSIGVLTKTLFAPWERQGEAYKGGFNIEALFETLIVNTIMRIVGFFIRGFVVMFGVLTLAALSVLLTIGFIFWVLLPPIIVILFVAGVRFLLL